MNIGLNDLTAKEARKIYCNSCERYEIKTADKIIRYILLCIEKNAKNKATNTVIQINEVNFFHNKNNYIKAFKKLRKLGYSVLYDTRDRENINIKISTRKNYLSRREQRYEFKIIKNEIKRNGEYFIADTEERLKREKSNSDLGMFSHDRLNLSSIEFVFAPKSDVSPYTELKNFPAGTYEELKKLCVKYEWKFMYADIENFTKDYICLIKVKKEEIENARL